jgi:hypothetical protein
MHYSVKIIHFEKACYINNILNLTHKKDVHINPL